MARYVFSEGLDGKVTRALLLLRSVYRHCSWRGVKLEVAVSGGKDSDVLIQLCKMADIWGKEYLRPLHRVTTIDPPYTLRHVREQGVEVLRPRKDFAHCILSQGVPSRFRRHCCQSLKEFVVEDYVVVGVRRCESVARMKRYDAGEPSRCVTYSRGGTCEQYYPLLEWSNDDIADFVRVTGLKCHPLYYDANGVFHVERRLGCLCCPIQYRKKRINEFVRYPRMLRFYCRYGGQWFKAHPSSATRVLFRDVFEQMACDLFYKDYDAFKAAGYAPDEARKYLEEYFNINLSDLV